MDKLSIWVTLFIGAIGWSVTHFADRVVSSPTIEYSLAVSAAGDAKAPSEARVTLTNLSNSISHKKVLVRLRKASASDIKFVRRGCQIIPVAPTSLGRGEGSADCDDEIAEFKAEVFPPQGKAVLVARFHGTGQILVQGGPADADAGSYFLAPASMQSWIVKNEFSVIFGALVVWLVLLGIIYPIARARARRRST